MKKQIIAYLKTHQEIETAILFGSCARGDANKDSDVDIALLFQKDHIPSALQLLEWRQDLADLVGKEVDLIPLNTISPILGRQVLESGQELFVNNQEALTNFEVNLITDYADLKIVRRPLESDILKRKFYD